MRAALPDTPFAFVWLLGLFFLTFLPGCLTLSDGKPPGPWYEAYEPIRHEGSETFMSNALARAKAEFGEPANPINEVLLRRSRKTAEARRYRIGEDFSLTECVDATNGVYVIYLAVDPDHRNYYALLGHECLHLLHPKITDWYMEGIATLFSEQLCAELEIPWGDWKRHFMRTRREPYAMSYKMMMELQESLPDEYPEIIRHTATDGKGPEWLRIDIDSWLNTLAPDQREVALEIIAYYMGALERKVSAHYYFTVPEVLR
jgi:hypothetical protein